MTVDWSCPLPLRDHPRITIAHGGGGQLGADLVDHLFRPAFGAAAADAPPTDSAVVAIQGHRLAFTTDSYVVQPLVFPGGDIGSLAVNGTVNDLAMAGAEPLTLSTGFVLEEGLELELLDRIARSMGRAASDAGVRLMTGDTKVVEAGSGDGLYVNTSGIGLVPPGVDIHPARARPGDTVIVSGPIGQHGIAVLSVRDGFEFEGDIESDCAPLNGLVRAMIATGADIRVMRDLTRGGLAAALCEIAVTADLGIRFIEAEIPVPDSVRAACGLLGLDPVHVANEGRLVAIVDGGDADAVLEAMHGHEHGSGARVVGEMTEDHPGIVTARTALGATRIVDRPVGEHLPRIC